ncbi:hypothetical protein GGS23DRAFT_155160 [Durotheca rogersii]|uniref:uncharacterized protein n=1 Tax=Durotheca rogersii TaxID=419775 RepID=UPI002220816C|nr:uncharacterized protein GGS23DRAFT_155160 [Durotheca rogersii]KAI5861141.1 hypothetical protein GGS23DRAFT_155160 [Durotheca rogersii]
MKEMWQTIKEYFGDGYVPGSAPFRYNVHCCEMKRPAKKSDNIRRGMYLDEEAMPLFTAMGDAYAPPCTCQDMQALIRHIDEFVETFPGSHPDDYAITSDKGDTDIDQVSLYTMRDSICWWVQWGGAHHPSHYWKEMYVGFATLPDDVQVPPRDFMDGTFRYLGYTWDECREGLLAEGISPEHVKFAEMCLCRQAICQYLEKVDPGLRPLLMSKTLLMTQYRVFTANTLGCGSFLLHTEGIPFLGLEDDVLEVAAVSHCLSLDTAKEAIGVLKGEKTETVAGDRAQLKRELRWVYLRCLEYLDKKPTAHLLRFASAGLLYVPMMDRYHERVRGNIRFPITEAMARILAPFVKGQATPNGGSEKGHLSEKVVSEQTNGSVSLVF